MSNNLDTDQFEYYLSSLDELGEILIEADRIDSVSTGILRLTLGTIMASNGAIFLFSSKNNAISKLSSISIKEEQNNFSLDEEFLEALGEEYKEFSKSQVSNKMATLVFDELRNSAKVNLQNL